MSLLPTLSPSPSRTSVPVAIPAGHPLPVFRNYHVPDMCHYIKPTKNRSALNLKSDALDDVPPPQQRTAINPLHFITIFER